MDSGTCVDWEQSVDIADESLIRSRIVGHTHQSLYIGVTLTGLERNYFGTTAADPLRQNQKSGIAI
jgi:hypothetical protein